MGITLLHWFEATTIHAGLAPLRMLTVASEEEAYHSIMEYHPSIILGGGSNTIGTDDDGGQVVIHCKQPCVVKETGVNRVCVPAGCTFSLVISFLAEKCGLGGLAPLSGIPGSLGGACSMNAGANGAEIGTFIHAMHGYRINSGECWNWKRGDGVFAYRTSPVPRDVLVTSVELELPACDDIAGYLDSIAAEKKRRREKNPPMASAGSVFRNPGNGAPPAGKLLEECGCKELSRGELMVSPMHANWIVNPTNKPAAARDAEWLVTEMKRRVMEKFNIALVSEWRKV